MTRNNKMDISILEDIFSKKSEGQELSPEEEDLLDKVNFGGNSTLSSQDKEEIKNTIVDALGETSAEQYEKASDELKDDIALAGVALVCTKVMNGVPILFEFKSVANARLIAKKIMHEE